MEAGSVHGELLMVPERVILAPAPGKFRPVDETSQANQSDGPVPPEGVALDGLAFDGTDVAREQVIGFVDGIGHSTPVRSPFHGRMMGLLRPQGARTRGSAGGVAAHGALMAGGIGVAIAGWGMAVPERRVTNDDLAQMVETSDAWITERTGIRERRWAGEGESTATLAIEASAAAIKRADLCPSDIGMCIVATCTPEQPLPPTGAFVQDGLGLTCGAFDLDAACSGFVYALVVGATMVASGGFGPVLVVGSETLSRVANPDDRGTLVLFGDGAGAVVLVPSAEPNLVAWDLACDGSTAHLLSVPGGGSRLPTTIETIAAGEHYLRMDGKEVYRRAVRAIVESAERTLAKAGVDASEIAMFVPHQANIRIIEAAASRLGFPSERVFVNIDRYGNTSAASVPIALAEAADEGRLHDGDLLLLCGFGAGDVVGHRRRALGERPLMGGRVALVTGASRGIGRAVAVALAADGHRVAVGFGSDAAAGEETCAAIASLGGEARAVQVDVASTGSVDAAFGSVEEAWGKVEVLVSNAGIARDGLLMRMGDDQWSDVLRTNLGGAFNVMRRATPGMVRARWGRIVLVGSVVALSGSPGQANYGAAKAGLIGLTRTVARELGSRRITVNLVAPGPIATAMTEALSDERKAQMTGQVPLGRFGTPEEVAAVVAFLCSDAAGYVSGAILPVDGGMGMGH